MLPYVSTFFGEFMNFLNRTFFLILPFLFLSKSFAFSHWNKENSPYRFGGADYVKKFSFETNEKGVSLDGGLNLSAELTNTPWTGDYWATWRGGITFRWQVGEDDESSYLYKKIGKGVKVNELSPAEKYDLYVGNYKFPLTKFERKRTAVMTKKDIPEWEGLCHAWAPATYLYKAPGKATVRNRYGQKITFYAADIKALLTYHMHLNQRKVKTYNLGRRCNYDFKKNPNAVENKAVCKDTNAGAFHIALANQIGLKNESFIIDKTRDLEVWNQAVFRYDTEVVSMRGPSRGADPRTVKEVVVKTELYYIDEENHAHEDKKVDFYENELDEDGEKGVMYGYNVEDYEYALELDAKNNIVGGSWISYERPDFLWKQQKPKFTGYLKKLKRIYKKSLR